MGGAQNRPQPCRTRAGEAISLPRPGQHGHDWPVASDRANRLATALGTDRLASLALRPHPQPGEVRKPRAGLDSVVMELRDPQPLGSTDHGGNLAGRAHELVLIDAVGSDPARHQHHGHARRRTAGEVEPFNVGRAVVRLERTEILAIARAVEHVLAVVDVS